MRRVGVDRYRKVSYLSMTNEQGIMVRSTRKIKTFSGFLMLCICPFAFGDVVCLKSGGEIEGKVKRYEDSKFVVEFSSGGKTAISSGQVQTVKFSQPSSKTVPSEDMLTLRKSDGSTYALKGRIKFYEDNKFAVVSTSGEERTFSIDHVQTIEFKKVKKEKSQKTIEGSEQQAPSVKMEEEKYSPLSSRQKELRDRIGPVLSERVEIEISFDEKIQALKSAREEFQRFITNSLAAGAKLINDAIIAKNLDVDLLSRDGRFRKDPIRGRGGKIEHAGSFIAVDHAYTVFANSTEDRLAHGVHAGFDTMSVSRLRIGKGSLDRTRAFFHFPRQIEDQSVKKAFVKLYQEFDERLCRDASEKDLKGDEDGLKRQRNAALEKFDYKNEAQVEGYPKLLPQFKEDMDELRQINKQQALEKDSGKVAKDSPSYRTFAQSGTFACQFSDYSWGMTIEEARSRLPQKEKMLRRLKQNDHGKYLSYNDMLFEIPCTITLTFTPITNQLASVYINLKATRGDNFTKAEAMLVALTKKYGSYEEDMSFRYIWGDSRSGKGDSLCFDITMGYLGYKSLRFEGIMKKQAAEAIEQRAKGKDASKL